MLHSQITANAQYPDKYDFSDFPPPERASMIEPDIASMTPDDLRQVLRRPFDFPEYAAKFEHLVAEKITRYPVKQSTGTVKSCFTQSGSQSRSVKAKMRRRERIYDALCKHGWIATLDLASEFKETSGTIANDLRYLHEQGRAETKFAPKRKSGGKQRMYKAIKPTCDTSPH